jgi:O-antigen/teichoic acid export membrane protein
MGPRVLWRRAATAAGVYGAALVGFLATVAAARELERDQFGVFALVLAITGFVQLLLDFTIDEALVKYGFRYAAREDYGRLRRLFRLGLVVKLGGGAAGTAGLLLLAPFAGTLFGQPGLTVPLLLAAPVPLIQAPEGIAAAAIILRKRTDVRGALLFVSMALRLTGIAVGAAFGVREAVIGLVLAQLLASTALALVGRALFRRFPVVPPEPLGEDAPGFRTFVIQSSVGSGISSARGTFPAVLVGLVTGVAQVAYFRVAQAPSGAFQSLSAPARLVLLAEQTHDFEHGRVDRLRSMLRRYMLGTGAAMAVLLPLLWWQMPALVHLIYGRQYDGAVDASRLILVAAGIQVVWGWSKSFPVSIGKPILRIVAQGAEIAVLIPLLLVFASLWGATGAAAAVLVSTLVFVSIWTVLLVRMRHGILSLEPAVPRVVGDEVLAP